MLYPISHMTDRWHFTLDNSYFSRTCSMPASTFTELFLKGVFLPKKPLRFGGNSSFFFFLSLLRVYLFYFIIFEVVRPRMCG